MSYDRLDYVLTLDTILGSAENKNRGSMWSLKEKEDLHFGLLELLHLYFDSEPWNDNLCDMELLTEWDNSKPIQCPEVSVEYELQT